MRIQIIGGISKDSQKLSEQQVDDFQTTCRSLGREIAKQGHTLILGSEDPYTADLYVAQGASEIKEGKFKIELIVPEDPELRREGKDGKGIPFLKGGGDFSDLENYMDLQYVPGPWNATHVAGIERADIVYLIGGGSKTENAAYVSTILETPVVAIPTFGGAAEKIWCEFVRKDLQKVSKIRPQEILKIEKPNQKFIGEAILEISKKLLEENPYKRENSQIMMVSILYGVAVILSLLAWLLHFTGRFGIESEIGQVYVTMLISAIIGGLTKFGINILSYPGKRISLRANSVNLLLGLLVSFIFLIIYLSGGLLVVWETDKPLSLDKLRTINLNVSLISIAATYLLESSIELLSGKLLKVLRGQ